MADRKRCCCNCRHNIRTGDIGNVSCHCEVDGHYISYVMCFEGWCRRWARETKWDMSPAWGADMDWRREARRALRDYPRLKRKQNDNEQQITAQYNGVAVQHSASRVTENVALRSTLTEREENIISAVEMAMWMQQHYPNGAERVRMMELVYFKRTHTIEGAAEIVHYSPDALWRWNTEILTAVYVGLKK